MVQKIQQRPKYKQKFKSGLKFKWPKKFKSGLSTVQKFKVVQKIQQRSNYEEKFKSSLSNIQNWISHCSIKRDKYAPNAPYNTFLEKDTIVLGVHAYCSVYVKVVPNGAIE